jgi:20S proteasome alpha/beta subunit
MTSLSSLFLVFITILLICSFIHATILIGIASEIGVVLSSSSGLISNQVNIAEGKDWVYPIGSQIIAGIQGDPSDCDYVRAQLESFEREKSLLFAGRICCRSMAYFCRQLISDRLRSPQRLQVNVLIAGVDISTKKPLLLWLDQVGSIKEVAYSTHGGYTPFILGMIDRKNHETSVLHSSMDSSVDVVKSCWVELRKRSSLDVSKCTILGINSDGICLREYI